MREIKFRAWDKARKEMTYLEGKTHITLSGTGVSKSYPYYILPATSEVMQYTGLKDKNGEEIYEGDIVQDKSEVGVFTGEIRFVCGSFCIWYFGEEVLGTKEYIPVYGGMEHYEVIGNIYENKDLIK